MKTVSNKFSLFCRLGIMAMALLLGQQALAIGTDAGQTVSNTTSVIYDVGGNTQPSIASLPVDFLVDRRVDFTVTADLDSAIVNPGVTGLTFDMDLQNDSNSTMDFAIVLTQLIPGDIVNGNDDTGVDVSNVVYTQYVDDLPEDNNTAISVTGDAAAGLANLDVANIRITVTAMDPSGDAGTPVALVDTSGVADDPLAVDNVLADGGNDGVEIGEDGFIVTSAAIAITKGYSVRYDPINGVDANAKAIPGAVVEYLITVDNTAGAVDATDLVISDTIDGLVAFVNVANNPEAAAEPYGGGTGNVDFGAGASVCLAESGGVDTNGDGCVLTGAVLTIGGVDLAGNPINVAAGASLEIRFRVLVPTP